MTFSYSTSTNDLARTTPAEDDFIGYDESLDDSPQQRQMFAFPGGRPLVFRSNSAEVQRGAVRADIGVALLGDLPGSAEDAAMVRLPGGAQVMERDLWLVIHRDLRHAPAVRAVADFLGDALAGE